MTENVVTPPEGPARRPYRSPWRALLSATVRQPRTLVGIALVVVIVAIAVVGPLFAPKSPTAFVGPPSASPSPGLPFGTDHLGRDVWSRFLSGGMNILWMALTATLLGVACGTLLGLTAGYNRGFLDNLIMRTMDLILTFPSLILALVVVAAFGQNRTLVVFVVALATTPRIARVVRATALEVVHQDYVQAAQSIGENPIRILAAEVLPNVSSPLIVETSLRLTNSIGVIASLAFLGFGSRPPNPDWGMMISENQMALAIQPWGVFLPVLAIAFLTIGTSFIGDGFSRAMIGIERSDAW